MDTRHAAIRAQQRAIPPLVDLWLHQFGEEAHDGHGCIRLYFSRQSIRRMEQQLGSQPVRMFKRFFDVFKVETTDGLVITRGWRTGRMRRP